MLHAKAREPMKGILIVTCTYSKRALPTPHCRFLKLETFFFMNSAKVFIAFSGLNAVDQARRGRADRGICVRLEFIHRAHSRDVFAPCNGCKAKSGTLRHAGCAGDIEVCPWRNDNPGVGWSELSLALVHLRPIVRTTATAWCSQPVFFSKAHVGKSERQAL